MHPSGIDKACRAAIVHPSCFDRGGVRQRQDVRADRRDSGLRSVPPGARPQLWQGGRAVLCDAYRAQTELSGSGLPVSHHIIGCCGVQHNHRWP